MTQQDAKQCLEVLKKKLKELKEDNQNNGRQEFLIILLCKYAVKLRNTQDFVQQSLKILQIFKDLMLKQSDVDVSLFSSILSGAGILFQGNSADALNALLGDFLTLLSITMKRIETSSKETTDILIVAEFGARLLSKLCEHSFDDFELCQKQTTMKVLYYMFLKKDNLYLHHLSCIALEVFCMENVLKFLCRQMPALRANLLQMTSSESKLDDECIQFKMWRIVFRKLIENK
jgi:hypothetical protein